MQTLVANENRWFSSSNESSAPDNSQDILRRDSLLVGDTCRIQGKLHCAGRGQFDGTIDGELVSTGQLIIGAPAVINAKVSGDVVIVYGRINGNIRCSEKLELRSGAKVYGDISSPKLFIEDGVVFEGFCQMTTENSESVPLRGNT